MDRDQRIIISYVHNENEVHKQYRYRQINFDYGLVGFGYHKTLPGYSYGPLIRDFAVIHFVVNGKGKAVVDNREYSIGKNQCFLFRPNQLHYYESSCEEPWEYYYFSFCGNNVDVILEEMGFAEHMVVRNIPHPEELIKLLQQLAATVDDSLTTYIHHGLLSLLIHQFITLSIHEQKPVQLFDAEFRSDLLSTGNYTRLACGIIHNNYAEPIGVANIAKQLNLSVGYLNMIFKQELNKTVHTYLTEYRLKKAEEMLKTTTKQVIQIAYETGFSDPLYFSRLFTKHFGTSPKQYRKLNQKTTKEM